MLAFTMVLFLPRLRWNWGRCLRDVERYPRRGIEQRGDEPSRSGFTRSAAGVPVTGRYPQARVLFTCVLGRCAVGW